MPITYEIIFLIALVLSKSEGNPWTFQDITNIVRNLEAEKEMYTRIREVEKIKFIWLIAEACLQLNIKNVL
jgi:hypothetical protein